MLQKIVTVLFLAGEPLPIATVASIIGVTALEVEKSLDELNKSLNNIGLSLLSATDGISIVTQSMQAPLVEKFWKEELKGDLTPATLQVLTLVAYLGISSREQISYIRGVQSSQSIRTLTTRGLISRIGEACTLTSNALKQLGVTKVEDLPEYQRIHTELLEKLDGYTP